MSTTMKFNLLHVYALVSVALVRSHAVTPEVYWKSVLPNTPMPKTVIDLLYTPEWNEDKSAGKPWIVTNGGTNPNVLLYGGYTYRSTEDELKDYANEELFFLEKDLHQGVEMNLHFHKYEDEKATFLPRNVADSIPFSSKNLPQIYERYSIEAGSMEAKIMKQTLKICENTDIEGEDIYCATSLESMVDFSTTILGQKVRALSTEVNAKESTPLQIYKIQSARKLDANEVVVCHKIEYAYAVFYCHKSAGNRGYAVSLVGVDGTKVKAVAVCHPDTSKWNPNHLAFHMLKVKPGSVPICHFLPLNHLGWVPYY